jgi:hypothetical protein
MFLLCLRLSFAGIPCAAATFALPSSGRTTLRFSCFVRASAGMHLLNPPVLHKAAFIQVTPRERASASTEAPKVTP